MPLFSPYFSLDSSAFRVGNGGRLRCRMGASGIGIYVMLLSHLRDCRDCRAPLDYDMLAFDLHEDAAAVRRVVEEFGLFDIDRSSGTFTSSVLTTVRGLLSDDAAAAGGGTVRTVRQRRVRSSGETYRRAVRRLAEDNALPPAEEEARAEEDAEPAEEVPTSSENAITPAEGKHSSAEEANATGAFVPTSIAAEGTPAEVKHESADAEGTPAEVEDQPAEEANATGDFADVRSPRTEEKRKEQNKKTHTPIVPFPQSGKGTRASHPAAAVVGEREEGAASAEGDEESVVGSPRFVSSAAAHADAPPCAASPTVLGTPAQTLDPHPSPDAAKADTSAEYMEMSTNHSQPNTLTTSEKADEAGRSEEGACEPFVPPTANEVRRFAEALCHPEFDAEWFVAYYTERHWRRHNGRPVVSWQTTARYWLDHPLRVARHLLGHRPAASPVSVGVGTASAVVVPPAGTTAAKPVGTSTHPAAGPTSSTSTGTHPVGTGGLSPRSSASPVGTGAPHVGSLSLPAPTPLQQSRLSDLKGMVLHLFADAPAAAPASASTSPDLSSDAADVSASVPTPATAASPSVRPARILSPAEAAQVIAQQTLAAAEAEAVPRVGERRATDSEELFDPVDPDGGLWAVGANPATAGAQRHAAPSRWEETLGAGRERTGGSAGVSTRDAAATRAAQAATATGGAPTAAGEWACSAVDHCLECWHREQPRRGFHRTRGGRLWNAMRARAQQAHSAFAYRTVLRAEAAEALAAQPLRDRALVLLTADGWTAEEIGLAVGASPTAVRQTVCRVRMRLRRWRRAWAHRTHATRAL